MLRYLLHRLLYTLPVIWLVVSIVFLLIHFVPGDPIQQMLGEGAASADIESARHAYGLDVPLGRQYLNYWKGVLHVAGFSPDPRPSRSEYESSNHPPAQGQSATADR